VEADIVEGWSVAPTVVGLSWIQNKSLRYLMESLEVAGSTIIPSFVRDLSINRGQIRGR
jgi:hypothetical protein